MEQAKSIFDMNELGSMHRARSTTNTKIVGRVEAREEVIIWPEADQVKTSI